MSQRNPNLPNLNYQMENPDPSPSPNLNDIHETTNRRIFMNNSINRTNNRSISISETESPASFYSPYHFDSPDPGLNSHSLDSNPNPNSNPKSVVSFKKYFSTKAGSSESLSFPATPLPPPPPSSRVVMFRQGVKEGMPPGVENGGRVEDGGERRISVAGGLPRRAEREVTVKKAALGFRICEVILCLVSFSVMASNKTRGWAGDSYYRYIEYRYLVGVGIIGFLYSAYQACHLTFCLAAGKLANSHPLRSCFDLIIDQILAYLLMSASSSAATRVLDWESNWGKDEFTETARASIGMSFLAFLAFAISSVLCCFSFYYRDSG